MAMLPYDINSNATYRDVLSAQTVFYDVATGRRSMCLVCSDPGIGKSLLAKRELKLAKTPFHELGVTPQERDFVEVIWQIESGLLQAKGRQIKVGISDDADGMWTRVTILNHLKSGWGDDRRRIHFPTSEALRNQKCKDSENEQERQKYKPQIADPSFPVTIGLIGLSNINYADPSVISDATARAHFAALVSKGLNPQWIDNDAAHDGLDVFLLTHYLATEANMLGGSGFTYEVARQAVTFYVQNVHRLVDIPPRRLRQIAQVIRDNPPGDERDRRLNPMLRAADQRPKLKLPQEWFPVLLWPNDPPRRSPPPQPPEPDTPLESDPVETVEQPVQTENVAQFEQPSDPPTPDPIVGPELVEAVQPDPEPAEKVPAGPEP